ncbi:polar amino acid transport system substrate-binding protein [Oceanospirillum multiglobuliferum]|uniref:Solute-binding protein family 3/N-terminal domain-containing protein n=1 Tax=Oceanospirillum multiglobuliferum TaxID=64969 RepID=A0A1T4LC49_9GAMM|nr:hypothetical protein [Oceanospirillum multiglobuliferum]OPX56714.1 hypothetical protein BTE48_02160 [Oceanospirillum multiglobuliferum]SJZ52309.1 polar amino acid transport system substrate-binding protein [Oceanospirillum multiglobuliferum]
MWSYYQFPPFLTAPNKGLLYDFTDLLNQKSQGHYHFTLSMYPRKRLDLKLATGEQGVVLFVNGLWMSDPEFTRYLWTPALLTDRNEIISRMDKPIRYNGDVSAFKGLTFGGILGREYMALTAAIARGEITREDSGGEDQNLKKLQYGRIDFTTMPDSTFSYFEQDTAMKGLFYRAETALSTYNRHLLVTPQLTEVHLFLTDFVQSLGYQNEWHLILKHYGLLESDAQFKPHCPPCS